MSHPLHHSKQSDQHLHRWQFLGGSSTPLHPRMGFTCLGPCICGGVPRRVCGPEAPYPVACRRSPTFPLPGRVSPLLPVAAGGGHVGASASAEVWSRRSGQGRVPVVLAPALLHSGCRSTVGGSAVSPARRLRIGSHMPPARRANGPTPGSPGSRPVQPSASRWPVGGPGSHSTPCAPSCGASWQVHRSSCAHGPWHPNPPRTVGRRVRPLTHLPSRSLSPCAAQRLQPRHHRTPTSVAGEPNSLVNPSRVHFHRSRLTPSPLRRCPPNPLGSPLPCT